MSVNSRPKAAKIIVQRKALYRQRIPESSCARKETVDMTSLRLATFWQWAKGSREAASEGPHKDHSTAYSFL